MSPTPRPPNSSGHETTDQRASYMVFSQARWASKPAAVSSEGNGPRPLAAVGTWLSNQARASDRNSSCSLVKPRSMARRI